MRPAAEECDDPTSTPLLKDGRISLDDEYFFDNPEAFSPRRQGGVKASIYSLVSTTVGGGVLSLPWVASALGVILGPALMILSAITSNYTIGLLIRASRTARVHGGYEDLMGEVFGDKMRMATAGTVICLTFMCCVGYLILMADILTPIVQVTANFDSHEPLIRQIIIVSCAFLVLPACCLKSLHALRFTSMLGLCSIILLVGALIFRSIDCMISVDSDRACPHGHNMPIKYWPEDFAEAMYACPIVSIAYICHFNALPMHSELVEPTKKRLIKVITRTMGTCGSLYLLCAMFGYLPFGSKTCGNILLNFRKDDPAINTGRVALAGTLVMSYPLIACPCRRSSIRVVSYIIKSMQQYLERRQLTDTAVNDPPRKISIDDLHTDDTISLTLRVTLTTIMISVATVLAISIPEITLIWAAMGSTVSMLISYVFPCMVFLKVNDQSSDKGVAKAIFVFSICMTVVFTLSTVYTIATGQGGPPTCDII